MRQIFKQSLVWAGLLLVCSMLPGNAREGTHRQKASMKAEFLRRHLGEVLLKKPDGKQVALMNSGQDANNWIKLEW